MVFLTGKNVALRKPAFQSTSHRNALKGWGFNASNAVDGDPAGNYPDEWSCSHTSLIREYSWWYVNLQQIYGVSSVVIYGRVDQAQLGKKFHL